MKHSTIPLVVALAFACVTDDNQETSTTTVASSAESSDSSSSAESSDSSSSAESSSETAGDCEPVINYAGICNLDELPPFELNPGDCECTPLEQPPQTCITADAKVCADARALQGGWVCCVDQI